MRRSVEWACADGRSNDHNTTSTRSRPLTLSPSSRYIFRSNVFRFARQNQPPFLTVWQTVLVLPFFFFFSGGLSAIGNNISLRFVASRGMSSFEPTIVILVLCTGTWMDAHRQFREPTSDTNSPQTRRLTVYNNFNVTERSLRSQTIQILIVFRDFPKKNQWQRSPFVWHAYFCFLILN